MFQNFVSGDETCGAICTREESLRNFLLSMLLEVMTDRDGTACAEAAPMTMIPSIHFCVHEILDPDMHDAVLLEIVLKKTSTHEISRENSASFSTVVSPRDQS